MVEYFPGTEVIVFLFQTITHSESWEDMGQQPVAIVGTCDVQKEKTDKNCQLGMGNKALWWSVWTTN